MADFDTLTSVFWSIDFLSKENFHLMFLINSLKIDRSNQTISFEKITSINQQKFLLRLVENH